MAGGTGAKFQSTTTTVAGTFALVATFLSIISIWFQLKNYRKPLLQRYVVRILLMVPIYGISSWVSMVSLSAASFLDPVRDMYEAFTIYTFFQLLINYLDGERALIIMTHGRAPVNHLWPMNYLLPKVDISDPYSFLAIKRGILQYAWLKPILAIVTIIMKATGVYQEGYLKATSGYLWMGIIYNVSVTVSLYSLGLFWVIMHDDLTPYRPIPKFLCIKLIIFASYWQGFLLSILVWLGALPDDVQGYTPDNLAAAIQDALICCEMPFFAIAHWYAFSWHDYADNQISSARLPVKFALRDAFGIVDLIEDSKQTFSGDQYSYRVFDSTGKVISHEDSSSRFARLKDGMRYQRGGEAKYWLPKPGEVRGELSANTPLLSSDGGPSGAGNPSPRYTDGSTDETRLDEFDEDLFDKARALEFGDWNYPVITANVPMRDRWDSQRQAYQQRVAPSPRPAALSVSISKRKPASPNSSASGGSGGNKGKEKQVKPAIAPTSPEPVLSTPKTDQRDAHVDESAPAPVEPYVQTERPMASDENVLGTAESSAWGNSQARSSHEDRSPLYGAGNEEAFQNVWGGGQ